MRTIGLMIIALFVTSLKPHAQENTSIKNADTSTYKKVEVEAYYPGGTDGWIKFLQKNLNANIPIKNGAPMGKYNIVVRFIVSKDGSVSGIEPETNLGYGMEAEVIRIITKSGNWVPAIQDKRTVNAYRRQPVTFLVQDDGISIDTKIPYTLVAGKDNNIYLSVKKAKTENISASVSSGTIRDMGEGKFIIKPAEPGRLTVTFTNNKNDKRLSSASFEVIAQQ